MGACITARFVKAAEKKVGGLVFEYIDKKAA